MARVIPNEPAGSVTPAVARFFRLVRGLPDDFTAWFALAQAEQETRPHFFVVWQERYGFLMQVAETSQQLAETALQEDFLTMGDETLTAESLGRAESDVLETFAKRVQDTLGLAPGVRVPIRRFVVFPNVAQNTIDEIVLHRSEATQTTFLGCHQLGERAFTERLRQAAVDAMPELSLTVIRKHFAPETRLPRGFSPLAPPERNVEASLTECLIDYDQEAVAKADLNLSPEGEALLEDVKARLVTGVAGSGKSLILIIRALLMARLHAGARLLVLTHNRPLNGELRQRFRQLAGHWPSFEWMTYFQWVRHCLPDDQWPDRILSGRALEELIRRLHPRHPRLLVFNVPFLLDELTWIKDHRLHERRAYLESRRQGREVPLSGGQREAVWDLFREFQQALESEGATDWSGVAMRFWKQAIQGALPLPRYDGIFVDEAQFFAPAWFDCVKAALRPGGQLFLCADPTQGFLRRRQSWLASGIDVRGRSVKLGQSYRNSREILTFASAFYRRRLGNETQEEAVNLPSLDQIAEAPTVGQFPLVMRCGSPQDMETRLMNEIVELAGRGLRPGAILVLHRTFPALESIHDRLIKVLGEKASQKLQDCRRPDPDTLVGLTTLNAGTGLEAPIVFVLGIDDLFEKEGDPSLSEEERHGLVRDHTRQLYMAMTRAAQRLVLLCHRAATAEVLEPQKGEIENSQ